MSIKKIAASLVVTGALVVGGAAVLPNSPNVGAVANDFDTLRWSDLFRDGSVACTGADDTSKSGGRAVVMPGEGEAHFTVKLKEASPNTSYILAVSEEPNCANAQFYPARMTNASGEVTFFGTYTTSPGTKNLLFNLSTTTPDLPENREISTKNTHVVIPAP